jgi:hypothetical protein
MIAMPIVRTTIAAAASIEIPFLEKAGMLKKFHNNKKINASHLLSAAKRPPPIFIIP